MSQHLHLVSSTVWTPVVSRLCVGDRCIDDMPRRLRDGRVREKHPSRALAEMASAYVLMVNSESRLSVADFVCNKGWIAGGQPSSMTRFRLPPRLACFVPHVASEPLLTQTTCLCVCMIFPRPGMRHTSQVIAGSRLLVRYGVMQGFDSDSTFIWDADHWEGAGWTNESK